MNVDLIFKIAAIGILVSILNIVLTKSGREEIHDDHISRSGGSPAYGGKGNIIPLRYS